MNRWRKTALRMEDLLGEQLRRIGRAVQDHPPVMSEDFQLASTVGYRLRCRLHRPVGSSPTLPAVLLCPGALEGGAFFEDGASPVLATELAELGIAVLQFDPAGRGGSWGDEDHGGLEHQDEVATLLAHLADQEWTASDGIGVLSVGEGITMAAGGVSRSRVPVRFLLDYEGHSDWETLTGGDAGHPFSAGRKREDRYYWESRDPSLLVSRLGCTYVRLQAEVDHSRGSDLRHARRMMRAALAAGLPGCQLNSHPDGSLPASPSWLKGGRRAAKAAILGKLRQIMW